LSRLHLDCIFASLRIEMFRNVIFLKIEKREMSLLVFIRWAHMILHAHQVFCVLSLIQLHSVTWFCSLFRWTCSENVYVSTFSISMFTFLKTSITWHSAWFWRVSSLHFVFNNLSSLSRWYHINALNVIFDLIIAEYICLAFANVTSQMKISSWLSISILMTWFAFIWRRCEFHRSFMFSCTSRTHTFDFNFIIEFSMCKLTVMSNLFDLRVKWVSSYFSEANVASWVRTHFTQTSYAWLSDSSIENMLHTLHAIYIRHNLYADFSLSEK